MERSAKLPATPAMSEFVVEEVGDEVLIYDQRDHRAHCLSVPAAKVWRLCAEGASVEAAERALAGTEDLAAVLAQLATANLVLTPAPRRRINRSRRAMMGKTAAVAGAVVISIVAPSVAEAASCGARLQSCCAGNVCNAGLKCQGDGRCH